MMAAAAAAESGAKVILIEKNKRLGKKLLLTGNGRCNITNAEFNLKKLVANYGKGGKFLFHAFFVLNPQKTIDFFRQLGIKTKIENNKRVFPVSEKAEDVTAALKKYLLKKHVLISLNSFVSKVNLKQNRIEKLMIGNKEITAKNYIFCTGGKSYPATGSTGDGFNWARKIGHSISELSPALTPINLKRNGMEKLQGLTLGGVGINVFHNNKKYIQETGDILFTHFGLSGPVILNISKEIGELIKQGSVKICLDLFPYLNEQDLNNKIAGKINKNPKKIVKSLLADFMPRKLASLFIKNSGIKVGKQIGGMAREERNAIAKFLKNIEFEADKLSGFNYAMITSGGVPLKEIDDKTMKSKIIDNLFFCGEIIDIDGKTGGFNLQACWSTGYLAGKSAIN